MDEQRKFYEALRRASWRRKQGRKRGKQQELVRCNGGRCWDIGQKPRWRGAGTAGRTEGAMYPALTWTATAVPLPPLRRRFHRDRRVTVSFLDRATSSLGTRTFCSASHIACTVRGEDDQRHKFELNKKNTNWQVLPR